MVFLKKNCNRCVKSSSARNICCDLVFGCQSLDSYFFKTATGKGKKNSDLFAFRVF